MMYKRLTGAATQKSGRRASEQQHRASKMRRSNRVPGFESLSDTSPSGKRRPIGAAGDSNIQN